MKAALVHIPIVLTLGLILMLVSGCNFVTGGSSTPTPEPTATFTPTAPPSPTDTAQFSQSEAISRLRAYFDLRFSETDKKFEQFMKQRAGAGEMLVDSPNYDASVVQVATNFTSEWEEWRSRAISPVVARYEGNSVWLITVTTVNTYLYTGVGGSPPYVTYEEQWWLFEQPGRPPLRNF